MSAPQELEKIGRYQVLERVGKGGMGVLYRGFDPVLDREVAIKLMHADFSEDTEQMRPRFYREARAAAKLQHRNIVTIFEFAEESNIPYIVMEFLKGTPLGVRMRQQPPLTLDDKMNVVAQLCDGLSYAHEQGVVHRDVKPDNVFLLEDGSVKLLDFGIAKLTSSTLTQQGDVLGSASYMSPEQVGGGSIDGRADVFSTGVVLYELLSGRKPFEGDSPTAVVVKILKEEPTPIESVTKDLPPEVVAIVMRALKKDPAERFPSAEAMGRELQSVRKSLHPSLSTARMDETRYASTQVMKALNDDFEKSGGGVKGGKPRLTRADATTTGAAATSASREASSRGWLMPAGIGAAVLAVVVAGVFMYSRGTQPAAAAPDASRGTGTVAAAPASMPPPSKATPTSTPEPGMLPASSAAPAAAPPVNGTNTPAASPGAPAGTRPAAESGRPAPGGTAKPAAMVSVSLTGNYPFEVIDGARSISPAARSHELRQPTGKTLQLRAPAYFLDQAVRVEGSANQPFDFSVPELGSLDVRSVQETCDIVIGSKKLGNPPLVVKEIAAGSYKVDLMCGTEVVKSQYATVRAGQTSIAAIR